MHVLSLKPGHDGAVAFVSDGNLVFSIESEKDSFRRYSDATAHLMLQALELAPVAPDVIALGGWHKGISGYGADIGAGYYGLENQIVRDVEMFGRRMTFFSSSHERSHIAMVTAMYPSAPVSEAIVLVWEGHIGAFYHSRDFGREIVRHHVLSEPGARYSALFAVADPDFPANGRNVENEYAGKLMALAAYGKGVDLHPDDRDLVERLLKEPSFYPFIKANYRQSALYNCDVHDPRLHAAARHMTDRIFEIFRNAAELFVKPGLPLLIAGGCGLNCDWNRRWSESPLFTDVFVPPCANDSGSAIGTAADAATCLGGTNRLEWSVYSGPDFFADIQPSPLEWERRPASPTDLAECLDAGEVVCWVQGRCEIGPRALGHRSLLASPRHAEIREHLNRIKEREYYRPVAPCCRIEELDEWFDPAIDDPYMLYFSHVRTEELPAITHVDGTARVQAVRHSTTPALHALLDQMRVRTGFGVLCNTSLNFKGYGFINRTSDLLRYCEKNRLNHIVIDAEWWTRRDRVKPGDTDGS